MARGEKFCGSCGARNGPRSWNCSACGKGFLVKGKQHPDIAVVPIDKQTDVPVDNNSDEGVPNYLFSEIDLEPKMVKNYGEKAKLYESACKRFRVLYGPYFMDVALDRPYKLLEYINCHWEVAKGKHRFFTMGGAIRSYQKRLRKGSDNGKQDDMHPLKRKALKKLRRAK